MRIIAELLGALIMLGIFAYGMTAVFNFIVAKTNNDTTKQKDGEQK